MSRVALAAVCLGLGFGLGLWAGRLTISDLQPRFAIVNEWASPVDVLSIGARAPNFDLPGVDGRRYRLSDFADASALAVVFTCNHCPTAQAYEDRLIELAEEYAPRGVAFVAISPNDPDALRPDELGYTDVSDGFEDMKVRAAERDFPFPYLFDGDDQTASQAYGPVATPHLFLFDRERRLRYAGRIDDADDPRKARSHDARNALEAVLANAEVSPETTRPFGCSIKWADKSDSVAEDQAAWEAQPVSVASLPLDDARRLGDNDTSEWIVLNLWATWCAPCVAELPELAAIQRNYGHRDLRVVTVNVDDPDRRDEAAELLRELHIPLTNFAYEGEDRDALADAVDPVWPGSLPHTVLIAPGGRIVYRVPGAFDPLELRRAIVAQLGRTYF